MNLTPLQVDDDVRCIRPRSARRASSFSWRRVDVDFAVECDSALTLPSRSVLGFLVPSLPVLLDVGRRWSDCIVRDSVLQDAVSWVPSFRATAGERTQAWRSRWTSSRTGVLPPVTRRRPRLRRVCALRMSIDRILKSRRRGLVDLSGSSTSTVPASACCCRSRRSTGRGRQARTRDERDRRQHPVAHPAQRHLLHRCEHGGSQPSGSPAPSARHPTA